MKNINYYSYQNIKSKLLLPVNISTPLSNWSLSGKEIKPLLMHKYYNKKEVLPISEYDRPDNTIPDKCTFKFLPTMEFFKRQGRQR